MTQFSRWQPDVESGAICQRRNAARVGEERGLGFRGRGPSLQQRRERYRCLAGTERFGKACTHGVPVAFRAAEVEQALEHDSLLAHEHVYLRAWVRGLAASFSSVLGGGRRQGRVMAGHRPNNVPAARRHVFTGHGDLASFKRGVVVRKFHSWRENDIIEFGCVCVEIEQDD